MEEQTNTTSVLETSSVLERVAQSIIVAYAWVSGPAMTEQERIKRELDKSQRLEMQLDSTSIAR
ncbi:MAG: hypothetical protein F4X65_07215 [Chloroflexi bacterium]|nr:hypothetical protein [Chloroflexota bacterium]